MQTKLLKDNRGMTMTEVLMAFLVLSIIMGLLSGIIAFSKKMFVNATDLRKAQKVVQEHVYKLDFKGTPKYGLKVYTVSQNGTGDTYELNEAQYNGAAVEFAQGVSWKDIHAYVKNKDGLSDEEVKAMLGDLDGMSFIVFSQYSP